MFGPQSQIGLFPADDAAPPAAPLRNAAEIHIRESTRARRLSIKVYPGGKAEVVVPRRTLAADVASFVTENREWIARARESFSQDYAAHEYKLPQRIKLSAVGKEVEVLYRRQQGKSTVRYKYHDNRLVLSGATDNEAACLKAIRRWLAQSAKDAFSPWLSSLSCLTEIPYLRMQIRAQKTCWGSRSSSGTISLNLCLLFLEPAHARYLMIHELCHGKHMNHSKRFWKLVARYEAEYRRLDRELGECWRRIPPWLDIY